MRWYKLAIFGLLATVFFVAAKLPAAFVWQKLQHRLPAVQLPHLQGSIWHARATSAKIDQVTLDSINLDFSPFRLLAADVASDFAVQKNDSTLEGEIHQTIGVGYLADLQGKVQVQDIIALAKQYQNIYLPVPLRGLLDIAIEKLRWHDKFKLDSVDGMVRLSDVDLGGQKISGSYQFDFRTEDNIIIVQANHEEGADVWLDANVTLKPDNSYTIKARIAAANGISNNAFNLLRMVGVSNKGEYREFQFAGKLHLAMR